ncbi:MAG: hypothetical protein ACK5Y2_01770 [Bdellovibrionales bacterium]
MKAIMMGLILAAVFSQANANEIANSTAQTALSTAKEKSQNMDFDKQILVNAESDLIAFLQGRGALTPAAQAAVNMVKSKFNAQDLSVEQLALVALELSAEEKK